MMVQFLNIEIYPQQLDFQLSIYVFCNKMTVWIVLLLCCIVVGVRCEGGDLVTGPPISWTLIISISDQNIEQTGV